MRQKAQTMTDTTSPRALSIYDDNHKREQNPKDYSIDLSDTTSNGPLILKRKKPIFYR